MANVQFLALVPRHIADTLNNAVARIPDGHDVTIVPRPQPEARSEHYQFGLEIDPAVVWMSIQVIGDAARDIALGLITSAIYDRLSQNGNRATGTVDSGANEDMDEDCEVELRFRDGTRMTIHSDRPLDRKTIVRALSEGQDNPS